jgi:uncharacterized protein YbjT (DUF2867 family)
MQIIVIGGHGRVGSKIVDTLVERGHHAVAADLSTGVNTITGEGLADALAGASAVVDASNAPSFEDAAVMEFFLTSTGNVLAAEKEAGVPHHVALSIVGSDRLPGSGYLRAKVAQEQLIAESAVPYTIVRATQFFEFVDSIADAATEGDTIRVPDALIQPMAADDVARAVAGVVVNEPADGIVEIGGPEAFSFAEMLQRGLHDDPRTIVADPEARYFGTRLDERSLVPGDGAHLGATRFEDWLDGIRAGVS